MVSFHLEAMLPLALQMSGQAFQWGVYAPALRIQACRPTGQYLVKAGTVGTGEPMKRSGEGTQAKHPSNLVIHQSD